MEVVLKKSKITASILKQVPLASVSEIIAFEVLGFCKYNDARWIVLYSSASNELRRYPYPVSIISHDIDETARPYITVKFDNKHQPLDYTCKPGENLIQMFEQLRDAAIAKGQFYI